MLGLDYYNYSARMYDPIVGRFTTMDPLCEKYYSISPYAYAGNNPVRFVDPTGKDILVWYRDKDYNWQSWTFNGTNQEEGLKLNNQFVTNFLTAYGYDIENGGGESLYELANNRDKIIQLQHGANNYHEESVVYWNPDWADKVPGGYVESPATILEHEMAHGLSYLTDPVAHAARVLKGDKQYDNAEERRVITGTEAKTAQKNKELPEGYIRPDHKDHGEFRVSGVTKTLPMFIERPTAKQFIPISWGSSKPKQKAWQ